MNLEALILQFLLTTAAVYVGIKLAAVRKAPDRECPSCLETVRASAVACRFCGRDIPAMQQDGN